MCLPCHSLELKRVRTRYTAPANHNNDATQRPDLVVAQDGLMSGLENKENGLTKASISQKNPTRRVKATTAGFMMNYNVCPGQTEDSDSVAIIYRLIEGVAAEG
jgi:hypothetical protein